MEMGGRSMSLAIRLGKFGVRYFLGHQADTQYLFSKYFVIIAQVAVGMLASSNNFSSIIAD
jgi:hypothetical protein